VRTSASIVVGLGLLLAACSEEEVELTATPLYDPTTGRAVIELSRELASDEVLYVRARRGSFEQLDCAELAETTERVDADGTSATGPLVDSKLTKGFYGPEWAEEPTAEMLASLANGVDSIIDVCIMRGDTEVVRLERDLFKAWDDARARGIGGKADNVASGEVMINTPQVYGVRCVDELGEIPFFEKNGDGTYTTYNCLDSTPIPVTVTRAGGGVDSPQTGTVAACDNPQYIYSLCEAGPRVASRINEQGTRWVMLCRKSIGGYASDQYNDIAMIGSNPFTGKACFFQNALYVKTDGGNIPHPADPVKSTNLWSGVHGGIGSGIECSRCHDADAFVHTPWIDSALDAQGRPVVPKMGVDPDFQLGANDTPYKIVNRLGQNWTMDKQLVSPQANACLRCHRMAGGRWTQQWLSRLEGTDGAWNGITTATFNEPAHRFWMPPDQAFPTQASWDASEAKRALDFIQSCGSNPSNPACVWQDIPEQIGGTEPSGNLRNPVAGTDDEIANQATTILGMNRNAQSQICAECHAPNQTTLNTWQEKTDEALNACLLATTGGMQKTENFDNQAVAQGELKTFGPFEVAAGGKIEVHMTGTGDADLHVKRGSLVSTSNYDCRPYAGTSAESCTPATANFNANGPAKFWVGVHGYTAATASVRVTYDAPGTMALPAKDIVDCMRIEPGHADSPFGPSKVGIYSAAAHLGWFQDTFRAAYPAGEGGNTADTWALEYGKFKSRVQMPKGNHPRLSQQEFDVVAEWFARGLPKLTTYIVPDAGPNSCTTTISPQVGTHATQMATQGWTAANRQSGINMYGCNGSQDPRTCLTAMPNANSTPYGAGWSTRGTIRILRTLAFNTVFWMRSSADGRFVANGASGGSGAVVSDLMLNKDIRVSAAYDPGFFPDNKGWMFQGTPIGAGFCTQSLLTSSPDQINFSEPQCSTVEGVSLYQHLGTALGGGDYFAVTSQFTSDFPSGGVNRDPYTGFGAQAQIKLTPMVFNGTRYVGKPSVSFTAPSEGDSVLSPSTKLVVSRFGSDGNQLGFVLRKINATPNAVSYDVTAPEIGRYCVQGGKPAISFDERYMVFHHYVGPGDYADLGFSSAADPTFQSMLSKGTANLVLTDLVTGVSTRITNMHPGQYALYPHFRSDGWIYFLARDLDTGNEYVAASDAALQTSTPVVPTTVTIDPATASVSTGGSVQLSVALDAVAPSGGTTVSLAVIPSNAGTAPASVVVPAGQSSATFTFVASASSGSLQVRATMGSSTSTATISVASTVQGHLVINEVDYDMPSTDNAELIEIHNPSSSPVSLAGKQVLLINGANGAIYATINLTGTIAANGYLVIAGPNVSVSAPATKFDPGWTTDKIQNGAPDGIALIDSTTKTLIDALSYEGSMTAINVPGFTAPISLVEGTVLTTSDVASAGSLCRRANQDTNNASADWKLCTTPSPGVANSP
jgi:hypothetical protein